MHLFYFLTFLSIIRFTKCDFSTTETNNPNEDEHVLIVTALFTKLNWLMAEIDKINKNVNNINERFNTQTQLLKAEIEELNQTIKTNGMEMKQQLFQKIDLQENLMIQSSKDVESFNKTINKFLTDGMEMKQQLFQKIDQQDNFMMQSSKGIESFNKTINKFLTEGIEMKLQLFQKMDQQQNIMTKSSKEFEAFNETLNKMLKTHPIKLMPNWLVILRRQDGSENFDRNWLDYKNGFGNSNGEFFIGLDKLHAITTYGGQQELLIVLKDFDNNTRYAKYDNFVVGNETEKYILKKVSEFSGDVGDSLSYHLNSPFTTKDQHNDGNSNNCASSYEGGWWFSSCYTSHLTGPYFHQPTSNKKKGIGWVTVFSPTHIK